MNEEIFEKIAENAYEDEMSKIASGASQALRSLRNIGRNTTRGQYRSMAKGLSPKNNKSGRLLQRMVDTSAPKANNVKRYGKKEILGMAEGRFIESAGRGNRPVKDVARELTAFQGRAANPRVTSKRRVVKRRR